MNWQPAQARRLANDRLHLHHGPIDLIIEAWGRNRELAYRAAGIEFAGLLADLCMELTVLRQRARPESSVFGPVASKMLKAVLPYSDEFITPMAAVAGAVADHVLEVMVAEGGIAKLIVNNGGDIGIYLENDQECRIACSGGAVRLAGWRQRFGVATSGWKGRSHSFGIADAVTVVATGAASADAAATMIANQTNLPDNPRIGRSPASALAPDSDLGDRSVTISVPELGHEDIETALARGAAYARSLIDRSLIMAALLDVQGERRIIANGQSPLQVSFSPNNGD